MVIKKPSIFCDKDVNTSIVNAIMGFSLLLITQAIIRSYLSGSSADLALYGGITVVYTAIISVWYAQSKFYRDILDTIDGRVKKVWGVLSTHVVLGFVILSSLVILTLNEYEKLDIEALFHQIGFILLSFAYWSLVMLFVTKNHEGEKHIPYEWIAIVSGLLGIALMLLPLLIKGMPR
jgi:hypothetical protein